MRNERLEPRERALRQIGDDLVADQSEDRPGQLAVAAGILRGGGIAVGGADCGEGRTANFERGFNDSIRESQS